MGYSEKTQRALDTYTRKLIKRLPKWLQVLFIEEKVFFVIEEDDGSLGLRCAPSSLTPKQKERAGHLIAEYMEKNPCKALQPLIIQ